MPLLVIDSGAHKGQRVALPTGPLQELLIGRDETATLRVQDKRASRLHCRVRSTGEQMMVEDMESRNGTYLNGVQLARSEVLQIGDQLQVGDTVFTVLGDDAGAGKRVDPWEGKEIGGYRILERVGRGGMGTVYRAVQKSLHREVALKVLSPKLSADPELIRNFVNEARAAGQLNHPNIVQVYDVQNAEDDGVWFFSMEYASSGSIMDALSAEGSLPADRALQVILDAARGLLYAEQKGIVHRDIKPDNMMVTADGVIKIGDLGLAQPSEQETAAEEGGRERPAKVFGTPHYIAPEQAQGKPVDHRADLYSLGASFYRIVAGRPPFDGKSSAEIVRKHLTEVAPPLSEVAPQLPRSFGRFTEKLMQKRPDDRYQSAADLIRDLEAAARGDSRRHLLIGGIAATILAVVGLLFALPRGETNGTGGTVVSPGDGTSGQGLHGTGTPGTGNPDGENPGTGGVGVVEPPTPPSSGNGGGEVAVDPAEAAARAALDEVAAREIDATLLGEALIESYQAVASAHPDAPSGQEAAHRARRIQTVLTEARQAEAEAQATNDRGREALSSALDRSKPLLEQRRYGQAIGLVTSVQNEHGSSLAGRQAAPGYISLYREQAEQDLASTKSRADELAKKSDWEQALDELQRVIDLFDIPDLTKQAGQLKAEIERERQRAREAERRAQRDRDRERLTKLTGELTAKRTAEATRYDYQAWRAWLLEQAESFETTASRDALRRRATDFEEIAALLAELTARYNEGRLTKVGFAKPSGLSTRTTELSFTTPGASGHADSDGRTFKVSFEMQGVGKPIVIPVKLSDFSPEELIALVPQLWEHTPASRVALGKLAAAEGLTDTASTIFQELTEQTEDTDAAAAARAALRGLGGDIVREDQARELIAAAQAAFAARDWATASGHFQRLARDYGDTEAVASLDPPSGADEEDDALPAYLAACRKAMESASAGEPDRYTKLIDWQKERARALATARGLSDGLERRRDYWWLGELYQNLESHERALKYYQRYEEIYRGSDRGEIESGRVFVRMASCYIYLKDDRSFRAALAKAGEAPKADTEAIDQCAAFAADFPAKLVRIQEILEKRKETRVLSREEQTELVKLLGELRLGVGQRAEIFNLLENFEVNQQPYTWLLIESHWSTGDYRAVRDLGPKFMTDFPAAPAVTNGEAAWRVAESLRLTGTYRRAITFYKWLQNNAPDSRRVRDGDVKKRIAECEKKAR